MANGPGKGPMNGSGQKTPLSLLERARTNDADAWRRLVELYRPLVLFWRAPVPGSIPPTPRTSPRGCSSRPPPT